MPSGIMRGEFAINGSFGTLFDQDGNRITEIQSVDASVRINRRDIMRAGTRQMTYKPMTVMGEGTLRLIKVTSLFDQIVTEMMRSERQLQRILNLRVRLDDPEALGIEEYRLTDVKLWDVPLGFNVNDIIEQSVSFTFENYEPITWISGDPTVSQHAQRYTPLDS